MIEKTMRQDWNKRATTNAYHWVASSKNTWDKDEYYQTGIQDIERYVVEYLMRKGVKEHVYSQFNAVDIGCGTGRLSRALAQVFRHVTGIDIAPKMIENAKADNADIPNVDFVLSNGKDVNQIQDQSVDFCFSYIVFQHIPSKTVIQTYLKEMFRILKTGGIAKFQVRGIAGNPPGKVLWFHGMKTRYVALVLWRNWLPIPWLRAYDSVYGACYTQKELQKLLQSIGFTNIHTFYETEKMLWAEAEKPATNTTAPQRHV